MNAGKSTALLQASHNYRERGMHPLILAPEMDTRDRQGRVTSRIGLAAKATHFNFGGNELYVSVCRKHFKEGMAERRRDELVFEEFESEQPPS